MPFFSLARAALVLALMQPPGVDALERTAADRQPKVHEQAIVFDVDAGRPGPVMAVEFIGNSTRLDTLLGLRGPADLDAARAGRAGPPPDFFRTRYPHYRQFRVGNTFLGYQCAGSDFDELVEIGKEGQVRYRFGQTLDMLQLMLKSGVKPHLALTGTPRALVPRNEKPIHHRNYGCVNAPPMDLSKGTVRERMPEWWALQDAFLGALVERFGVAEVRSWTFATWTEPLNPERKSTHLVLPKDIVQAGQHDEGVATLLATSIDVAMKHGLRIRLGNMAGHVQEAYPAIVAQIARLPRGRAYLDYIDAYGISRYRTKAGADIGLQVDSALSLLTDPRMPAKGLYIDELGDLAGLDGVQPFPGATGLDGARQLAAVLARVFERQDGSTRVPRGVAFWRDQIEPRPRKAFSQTDSYLRTASSHVIDLFADLIGLSRLPTWGPAHRIVAGSGDGHVKVLVLPSSLAIHGDAPVSQTRTVSVRGLRPGIRYEITQTEVGRDNGNPISVFLEGSSGAMQDARGRFRPEGGKLELTPRWEACYYDEDASCAWRQKARAHEAPRVLSSSLRADRAGVLTLTLVVDEAAVVMLDLRPQM